MNVSDDFNNSPYETERLQIRSTSCKVQKFIKSQLNEPSSPSFVYKQRFVANTYRKLTPMNHTMKIWSRQDQKVFIHQFLAHPKLFHIIALHLQLKTTKDCVLYYYLYKKRIHLKRKVYSKGIYTPKYQD